MTPNGWYPLALSTDIAPGTSAGTRVEGKEFVVWRDSAGAAHVWEDRCPHRGMKLSFGFVRGDHIACLYHGWRYGTDGQCRYIPAHPDLEVPSSIRVPRFAVAEVGGIIWGCFDDEGEAPPAPALPTELTPLRSVFIDCPARTIPGNIAATGADVTETVDGIFEITVDGKALVAGVQPLAEDECALHLVAKGKGVAPETLKALAGWTEQLRRSAEAGSAVEVAA